MNALKRVGRDQEFLIFLLLLALLVAVVVKNPTFLHIQTVFDIIRTTMVSGIFAMGVLVVLIAGGIDVSFLTIGIFAAYTTVKVMPADGGPGMALLAFLISVGIGSLLGLVNALVVVFAKVTTLIATLATSAIFLGFMAIFIGSEKIPGMPTYLEQIRNTQLITTQGAVRGTTRLNVMFLLLLAVVIGLWAFLRWTVLGRSFFALGGDADAAHRAGIRVTALKFALFSMAGALAGLAGIVHVTLSGEADPATFVGTELDVLAAVVLGGALITGGKGSVRGTVLGVLTIAVIKLSLIPLGIPPTWERAVVGLLLLLGVVLQAWARRGRHVRPILDPEPVEVAP